MQESKGTRARRWYGPFDFGTIAVGFALLSPTPPSLPEIPPSPQELILCLKILKNILSTVIPFPSKLCSDHSCNIRVR